MLMKLQRSEKAVEDYMTDQRKSIMLKQELRKLKEEDLKKIMERQKRLEFKKKMEIMDKQKSYENIVNSIRDREHAILNKRQ